jgi:hypothetical protein
MHRHRALSKRRNQPQHHCRVNRLFNHQSDNSHPIGTGIVLATSILPYRTDVAQAGRKMGLSPDKPMAIQDAMNRRAQHITQAADKVDTTACDFPLYTRSNAGECGRRKPSAATGIDLILQVSMLLIGLQFAVLPLANPGSGAGLQALHIPVARYLCPHQRRWLA